MHESSRLNRRSFLVTAAATAAAASGLTTLPGFTGTAQGATTTAAAKARESVSLNGDQWTFQAVKLPFFGWEQSDSGIDRSFIREAINSVSRADWGSRHQVRVPMTWNSIREFDHPEYWHYIHKGTYRRTFAVPKSFRGHRVKLHFGGVNWRCWIFVNGTQVHAAGHHDADFSHEFALTPFDVDISHLVEPGSDGNTLEVVVQDITANMLGPSPNEQSVIKYPMGVRGEYWPRHDGAPSRSYHDAKSGIWGDVTLLSVPAVRVDDVFVRPNVKDNTLTAELTITNESGTAATVVLRNTVTKWPDGRAELSFEKQPRTTVGAGSSKTVKVTQPWDAYDLWWPDKPVLYNLNSSLLDTSGKTLDTHVTRFGVRDVRAVADEDPDVRGIYLNGIRTGLRGESIEVNIAGKGAENIAVDGLTFNGHWALTRSYFSHVIDVAKSMNINILRIHRGWGLSKELVDICDEKGMMLIAENPIVISTWEYPLTARYWENGVSKVLGIARSYRNHPSIVLWSISNENAIYNDDLTLGMRSGYAGAPAVNPDIQLVSTNAETDTVYSRGYMGTYITNPTVKTWFTYEENASYIEPQNTDRHHSVIKSMRIFRQQRMSLDYDAKVQLAFYSFQKVFALPAEADPARPESTDLSWTADEIRSPGYHADHMWQSVMNPYTQPARDNVITEFSPSPMDLWKKTYAPVAVFDKGWVDYAMKRDNLTYTYNSSRLLHLFNSDLDDQSEEITVTWTLIAADGSVTRTGSTQQNVPIGGSRSTRIDIGSAPGDACQLRLTASKSGTVRFRETLQFGEPGTPID
ncbi:sugar-binding domain-containing protein [Streptomyces sp. ITFR-16]|uniref:glycoside hydrolase family 2 protein n=1 Tax=Streptomyces sp. ITFR-16 TaxID=3075198 RepID=UPI00288A62CA|nr:sugar-binding domain-containing protein [Streptomyces sp. ITFR-16]WNI21044.1 glycoside hydrolase family 2 TIM barrel-domain containing protein [Streptomyces sp. ITFR-16]